jgi:hypothetical protein
VQGALEPGLAADALAQAGTQALGELAQERRLLGSGQHLLPRPADHADAFPSRPDRRTGRLTKIKAFPDPKLNQAWAALDGRWLVWNEYHDFNGFNDFTTWAWDTHARKLVSIGSATRGPTGEFWDSPWRGPDIRDGRRHGYKA